MRTFLKNGKQSVLVELAYIEMLEETTGSDMVSNLSTEKCLVPLSYY